MILVFHYTTLHRAPPLPKHPHTIVVDTLSSSTLRFLRRRYSCTPPPCTGFRQVAGLVEAAWFGRILPAADLLTLNSILFSFFGVTQRFLAHVLLVVTLKQLGC